MNALIEQFHRLSCQDPERDKLIKLLEAQHLERELFNPTYFKSGNLVVICNTGKLGTVTKTDEKWVYVKLDRPSEARIGLHSKNQPMQDIKPVSEGGYYPISLQLVS